MSGDHNMNQSDPGWRKRQIALDKKAENARELGLDYEPSKTIQEMVQKATGATGTLLTCSLVGIKEISDFAALVRADERETCAKWYESEGHMMFPVAIPDAIRSET